jgi:hypothetical protein
LRLTCRGEAAGDVLVVLDDVRQLVGLGITSGFDRRGPGRFHFQVQDSTRVRRLG